MDCGTFSHYLDAWFDQELGPDRSLDMEEHVKTCEECEVLYRATFQLRKSVGSHFSDSKAPASLRTLINLQLDRMDDDPDEFTPLPRRSFRFPWLAAAVVFLGLVGLTLGAWWLSGGEQAGQAAGPTPTAVDGKSGEAPRAVQVLGQVTCLECENEMAFGVKANCPETGCRPAIKDKSGRIYPLLLAGELKDTFDYKQHFGQWVSLSGTYYPKTNAIQVLEYNFQEAKAEKAQG